MNYFEKAVKSINNNELFNKLINDIKREDFNQIKNPNVSKLINQEAKKVLKTFNIKLDDFKNELRNKIKSKMKAKLLINLKSKKFINYLKANILLNWSYKKKVTAVDAVVIAKNKYVLLIQRLFYPNGYAIPGGFIDKKDKTLNESALRELFEETSITNELPEPIKFKTYEGETRDPRGHSKTTVFIIKIPKQFKIKGRDDALTAKWIPLKKVKKIIKNSLKYQNQWAKDISLMNGEYSIKELMAFDHERIINDVLKKEGL